MSRADLGFDGAASPRGISPPVSNPHRPLSAPPRDFGGSLPGTTWSDTLDATTASNNSSVTRPLQRPLQRLRNDEVSTARHQVPAVYEALVQYDSLYLNAEARIDAKENELTRCIEVGQEVLMQLHAVRQRCAEMEDERDAAVDAKLSLERQLQALRQTMKQMENHFEAHFRSASTESGQHTLRLESELHVERQTASQLREEIEAYKQEVVELNHQVDLLRRDLEASEQKAEGLRREAATLRTASMNHALQHQSTESEVAACLATVELIRKSITGGGDMSPRSQKASPQRSASGRLWFNVTPSPDAPVKSSEDGGTQSLRSSLMDLHRLVSDLQQRTQTAESSAQHLDDTLQMMKKSKDELSIENQSLRSSLVEVRSICEQFENEARKLKDASLQSPLRTQILQEAISDKNQLITDVRKLLESKEAALAQQSERIRHLERQMDSMAQELAESSAAMDWQSQALEASQRIKIAEQTVELLRRELDTLRGVQEECATLRDEQREYVKRIATLEAMLHEVESQCADAEAKLRQQQSESSATAETLAAIQADLYEAQVERDALRKEKSSMQAQFEQELMDVSQKSVSMGPLLAEVQHLKNDNSQLRDALAVLQRESKELQEALSRVAMDEQQSTTTALTRVRELEQELEATSKKLTSLSLTERTARMAVREAADREEVLKDNLDQQKRRMTEFLQTHIPSVMFQELERDFTALRAELAKVRSEAVASQESVEAERKQRMAAEEAQQIDRSRIEAMVAELKDWESRLAQIEAHVLSHKGSTNAKRSRRFGSMATTFSKGPHVDPLETSTTVDLSPIPASSPRSLSSGQIGSVSALSPSVMSQPGASSSSTTGGAAAAVAISLSSAARRFLDVIAESLAEQRLLIHSLQERVSRRSSPSVIILPPETVLTATPQTYAAIVTKSVDATLETFDDLGEQISRAVESSGSRSSQLKSEFQQATSLAAEHKRKSETLQIELNALIAQRDARERELSAVQKQLQSLADEKQQLTSELSQEKGKRLKLEKEAESMNRQLEDTRSDVQFEAKSLAARLDNLKQQLASERQEHQVALARVFDELSAAKQDAVQARTATQEALAAEVKKRKQLESECEELRSTIQLAQTAQADLQDRAQRYASMLQTARQEVEHVTVTLNEVEGSLQADVQRAELDAEAARAALVEEKQHAAQLQISLDACEQQLRESRATVSQLRHQHDATNASSNGLSADLSKRLSALQMEAATLQSSLQESTHIIASLEQRCAILQQRNEQLELSAETDANERQALLQANQALEARIQSIDKERDPLRQQLRRNLMFTTSQPS